MATGFTSLPLARGFGETSRRDRWWLTPLAVFVVLTSFIIYATWAAFQGQHYTYGPYLSPFYSPEIFGTSEHAWLPVPTWWPDWLVFSPALLILGGLAALAGSSSIIGSSSTPISARLRRISDGSKSLSRAARGRLGLRRSK